MNKFKKYLKENYKRILLVILIVVGYIGLLFACKYANNDLKESATNINVLNNNKSRKYRINESKQLTNIIDMGVLSRTYFGSDSNTITFSKESDIQGISLLDSRVGVETELQLTNTTSDSVVISYKMYDLFYQNNIIFTDTILLGGYFVTDKYLTNFGQYCYFDIYNNGVALIENGTLSKSMNEHTYLFSIDSFTPISETVPYNYDLTLRFDFNRTSATTTKIKFSFYLFAYNLSELVNDSYLDGYDDGYNEGYDTGYDVGDSDGYDNGYDVGIVDGYLDGYDNGYNDGIGTATNINYNSSVFKNYNQFTMNYNEYSIDYVVSNRNIVEFPYTFNPTLNGLDTANLYNDVVDLVGESHDYNFTLTSNYNTLGFGGIKWSTYQSGGSSPVLQINLLDINDNIIVSFDDEDFTFDSHFYYTFDIPGEYENYNCKFQFLINIDKLPSPPWMISLISNGTFESGLQQGIEQGKQDVLNNLGNYDLYNKNEYIDYGESQKQIGINIGKTSGCSVNNLFFAIADIPTRILSSLLSFELFGINMFLAFGSIATLLLIIWVIRKVK